MTESRTSELHEPLTHPCRFLYLASQLAIGGAEKQLYYLLKALPTERYRPWVAVWNYDETDRYVPLICDLSVPVVGPPRGSSPLAKLRWLRRLVARLKPELAHSYLFYTNAAVAYACLGTGTIPVGSIRCDFEWERRYSGLVLGRLSARWPRNQICNSWAAAQNVAALRWNAFRPAHVDVVQNAVDLVGFRPADRSTGGRITISGLGALSTRKNWATLLPVTQELVGEGLDIVVRIAGEGPRREDIENEARERGLEDRFVLIGRVEDVPSFLAQSDVVVHVSDAEGTPNVVLEAMAAGRPVVAVDSGDMGRLVEDGVTGYVVPRGRMDTFADRLRRLVTDRSSAQAMGRAARARAEKAFGLGSLADRTLAAYATAGWTDPADIH